MISFYIWFLHELEAFICKASKGEAIVNYCKSLVTQQIEASGSPDMSGRSVAKTEGWKLMRKNRLYSFLPYRYYSFDNKFC